MNTSNDTTRTASSAVVPTPWVFTKNVISEADLDGQLVHLGPKAEKAFDSVDRARALYVADGEVTVQTGPTHYMLKADAVLPIPADRAITVRNHGDAPARVLELLLPAPRVEWRMFVPDGAPVLVK